MNCKRRGKSVTRGGQLKIDNAKVRLIGRIESLKNEDHMAKEGGLSLTGKMCLPWRADAGFDVVRRGQQGFVASRIRLSKRNSEIKSWKLLTTVVSE
jgi:hypothetical protein